MRWQMLQTKFLLSECMSLCLLNCEMSLHLYLHRLHLNLWMPSECFRPTCLFQLRMPMNVPGLHPSVQSMHFLPLMLTYFCLRGLPLWNSGM